MWPVLRVTPHRDDDGCGYQGTHAAYSLTYAIPVLCQFPERPCAPFGQDTERLRRACAHCFAAADCQGGPTPGDLPVAWWDLTAPQTVRAEAVAPEELLASTALVSRYRASGITMQAPEPYRWRELADRILEWQEANPAPRLGVIEQLALAGVHRHVALRRLAYADEQVRRLLPQAHDEGLGSTRLEALSGVSRRTIPGWLAAAR